MQALIYHRYGPAENLHWEEIATPAPRRGQVQVRVRATALNPVDVEIRQGRIAVITGYRFPRVPGSDFVGEITALGAEVQPWSIGDWVMGFTDTMQGGAMAEHLCVPAHRIGRVPVADPAPGWAGLPLAAQTALQALRNDVALQKGEQLLINGASGGVGVYAVQIGRLLGAAVTGICSHRNVDLVRDLGAQHLIDYTQTDYLKVAARYDVIFDVYGNQSWRRMRHLLRPGGRFISTIPHPRHYLAYLPARLMGQQSWAVVVRSRTQDLHRLADWVQQGDLRLVTDRVYPWEEAVAATQYLETRRAKGKVIVEMAG